MCCDMYRGILFSMHMAKIFTAAMAPGARSMTPGRRSNTGVGRVAALRGRRTLRGRS